MPQRQDSVFALTHQRWYTHTHTHNHNCGRQRQLCAGMRGSSPAFIPVELSTDHPAECASIAAGRAVRGTRGGQLTSALHPVCAYMCILSLFPSYNPYISHFHSSVLFLFLSKLTFIFIFTLKTNLQTVSSRESGVGGRGRVGGERRNVQACCESHV